MKRIYLFTILIFLIACGTEQVSNETIKTASLKLNLDKPIDNLTAFLKTRMSLEEGKEVIYWWTGKVYSFEPQKRGKLLFDFEGFNVGRMKKQGDSIYQFLTKEVSFYKDPKSKEILSSWVNPFIEDTVEVVHVWNDPVNIELEKGYPVVTHTSLGNDRLCLNADILLAYPSALPRKEYPKYSKSDIYQSAELFQFFVDKEELDDPKMKSVNAEMTWTRVGDWLPWMEMGDRPGYLIYQCRGYKLKNGFQDLPKQIQDYIESHDKTYAHAPEEYSKPNETSWSYFKKLKAKGAEGLSERN